VRNDSDSSTTLMPSTANAQTGDSISCGLMSFSTPSKDREHAAQAEEHQRHDEGPEIPCGSVAERVGRVGGGSARRAPSSNSDWLPVSASEWIDSASIDASV